MAVKMNLWSLTLLPGEKYPMLIPRDFQITNAALGEELRSTDGRSVVKVTHQPIPPSAFDSDDDSDDEIDSDLEGELDDEFDLDEEDDEEDEEEAEGPSEKKVKAKVNGTKAVEEDDDDEDDEDEEDDSDFEDDEDDIPETNVICSLTAGKIEQTILNLTFVEGDVVQFEVTGENAVHLLGNYIDQYPNGGDTDSEYDSEFDSEYDDYSDLIASDEDDIDGPTIEEIDEITVSKPKPIEAKKPKVAKPESVKAETKPAKAAAAATPAPAVAAAAAAPKRKAEEDADVSMTSTDGLSKKQKKLLAKKAKLDTAPATKDEKPAAAAAAAPAKAAKAAGQPQKKTLPSGLIIEDLVKGDGPIAKPGKRLGMRYIGKLENGKQFDSNTAGAPFKFMLGRGEVIKGWDEGLAGMQVGGERRLTIPSKLAYGSQKLPGIPKNSTLKFDVKLLSVS